MDHVIRQLMASGGEVALTVSQLFKVSTYTGNGSTQSINNGVDLVGQGGLVWIKARNSAEHHRLVDTVRGAGNALFASLDNAAGSETQGVSGFNSDGFSLGSAVGYNANGEAHVAWAFRKAANFFDVVTYTGNGATNRQIAHSLGSAPGFLVIKRRDSVDNWMVYHRSIGTTKYLKLNSSNNEITFTAIDAVTSTYFISNDQNDSGATYVAYLFAHDTAPNGLIQCGSYTGTGASGNAVSIGWEPQFVLVKPASNAGNWYLLDTTRGFAGGLDKSLYSNSPVTEQNEAVGYTDASGFVLDAASSPNANATTHIYIAIRKP